jgi:hypothetical protein
MQEASVGADLLTIRQAEVHYATPLAGRMRSEHSHANNPVSSGLDVAVRESRRVGNEAVGLRESSISRDNMTM